MVLKIKAEHTAPLAALIQVTCRVKDMLILFTCFTHAPLLGSSQSLETWLSEEESIEVYIQEKVPW